ncbi:MAG: DNA-processing protein DprA, partial [Paracoccaceae bacterium]
YPTPFTPPTTVDDKLSWLRLIRSRRVGVATFHRLIADHGTARAALAALPGIAAAAGIDGYEPCPEAVAQAEMRAGAKTGARLILHSDPDYPAALLEVADAPPVLWARGATAFLGRPMIALVGARNASSLGGRMARALAEGLSAEGQVIVSGLARGIDTVAHQAALSGGTVAVMAGGLDIAYPPENEKLLDQIAEQGLILSEQPFGLEPQARHFPLRNRIISGLVRAVVVVEAAHGSGSLITARAALEQGREVMAVPGHPFDARASGCNQLIRDGATLVRGAADVLAALGQDTGSRADPDQAAAAPLSAGRPEPHRTRPPHDRAPPAQPPSRPSADIVPLRSRILDSLGPSPLAEDQLIRDLGLPAAAVSPELVSLELEGRIARQAGGLLSLVS